MNRVIKFRGKRIIGDDWVFGDLESRPKTGATFIHQYYPNGVYHTQDRVEPESVGQFTGLQDAHGDDIYEGDIIRHKDMVKPYHVIYDGHQFTPNDGFRSLSYPKHWEVIGNIHDNPELLEKGGEQ